MFESATVVFVTGLFKDGAEPYVLWDLAPDVHTIVADEMTHGRRPVAS